VGKNGLFITSVSFRTRKQPQFISFSHENKMKFLILLLILPAFCFAGISPVTRTQDFRSCPQCAYSTTQLITSIGTTLATCTCPSNLPVKVALYGSGKFCCNAVCPTCLSYTMNTCSCPAFSGTWVQLNVGPPGGKCCDLVLNSPNPN
jgi:hypothetical protein